MKQSHWPSVAEIFQQGIDTKMASFEEKVPTWEEFNKNHHAYSRFVAIKDGEVVGWAALQPVSQRHAYRGVAEVSEYVKDGFRGQGIGKELLRMLIHDSEKKGIWMLTAVILKENNVSIQMHQSQGFRFVGVREKIAQKNGKWIDTVLMDRRSKSVGT